MMLVRIRTNGCTTAASCDQTVLREGTAAPLSIGWTFAVIDIQGSDREDLFADLRPSDLAKCDAEIPTSKVAIMDHINPAWARQLKRKRRESSATASTDQRHGPRPRWATHVERVARAVREAPAATAAEHGGRLGRVLGASTHWRAIKVLGIPQQES